MSISVAVQDKSTVKVPNIEALVFALNAQANHLVAGGYEHATCHLRVPETHDWELIFVDDSDQVGALGYHDDEDAPHLPRMIVAVRTCEKYGVSPSSCASHELCEAVADPFINLAAFDGASKFYALEIGDPVQNESYTINGVEVSNFVTTRWFDPEAPAGAKLDHLGKCTAPFHITAGGYTQYVDLKNPGAGWQQVGADKMAGHTRRQRSSPAPDEAGR